MQPLLKKLQSLEQINSEENIQTVKEIIKEMLNNLPGPITIEKLRHWDNDIYVNWNSIAESEYSLILNCLIGLFNNEWPLKKLENGDYLLDSSIYLIFSIDHSTAFILSSLNAIFSTVDSTKFEQLIMIFEKCLKCNFWLPAAIMELSCMKNDRNVVNEQQFIQFLVGAPIRAANYFKGNVPNTFNDDRYCGIIMLAILNSIFCMAKINQSESEIIFKEEFISKLFGRIIINFNKQKKSKIIPKIFTILNNWSTQNQLRTSINKMIYKLNRSAIEIAVQYILDLDEPQFILGECINKSADWKYVLVTKFPLNAYTTDTRQIYNLVRYLSCNGNHLNVILEEISRIWSVKSSISLQSIEQQIYYSKFILLALKMMNEDNLKKMNISIKSILHKGVKAHLEALDSTIRVIGMITAEISMNFLNKEDQLLFDYDNFAEEEKNIIAELRHVMNYNIEVTRELNLDNILQEIFNIAFSTDKMEAENSKASALCIQTTEIAAIVTNQSFLAHPSTVEQPDSDDDDDLKPYDMPDDDKMVYDKRPRFVMDLLDLICNTDDPDVYSQCMMCSTELIKEKLSTDITDIAIKCLATLITIEERFYMENFEQCRFSGCVAVVTIRPKQSAEYLCNEFNCKTKYSINKRILMLNVLCQAAKDLSFSNLESNCSRSDHKQITSKLHGKLLFKKNQMDTLVEARRIISERLEGKTRRFTSSFTLSNNGERINRFAPVAGYFFFPLIKALSQEQYSDFILQQALLNALTNITYAAQNCPIIAKISSEVFGVSTLLRFHPEPKIRLSILQMIAAALIATPPVLIQTHFVSEIQEIIEWLNQILKFDVFKGEVNAECRELAKHVLSLSINILKEI